MNIRIAGFGGQGIVMAGYTLGHAGVLDGRNALQTQSYGSESRGGSCKSDVMISDGEILELAPSVLDVLVVMSQPALYKYLPDLRDDGILIYDRDLVKLADPKVPCPRAEKTGDAGAATKPAGSGNFRGHAVPATDIAHETLGNDLVANMIMLGYLAALTQVVSADSLRNAIAETVPRKTVEINLRAFVEGSARAADQQ